MKMCWQQGSHCPLLTLTASFHSHCPLPTLTVPLSLPSSRSHCPLPFNFVFFSPHWQVCIHLSAAFPLISCSSLLVMCATFLHPCVCLLFGLSAVPTYIVLTHCLFLQVVVTTCVTASLLVQLFWEEILARPHEDGIFSHILIDEAGQVHPQAFVRATRARVSQCVGVSTKVADQSQRVRVRTRARVRVSYREQACQSESQDECQSASAT